MMRIKLRIFATALAFGTFSLGVAPLHSAGASTTPPVADAPSGGVVETETALYFEAASNAGVIFYFPKLETQVAPVEPVFPGSDEWQASLVYKKIGRVELGRLNPNWADKILRPYVFTPTAECTFAPPAGIRSIRELVLAKGRDLTAPDGQPVCQFFFRVPMTANRAPNDEAAAALHASATAGSLIGKPGKLSLIRRASLPWADLRNSLNSLLTDAGADTSFDVTQASFYLGIAVGRHREHAALVEGLTHSEKVGFLNAALAQVFEPAADPHAVRLASAVTGAYATSIEQSYDL